MSGTRAFTRLVIVVAAIGLLIGCGAGDDAPGSSATPSVDGTVPAGTDVDAVRERLDQLDELVSQWMASSDLPAARAAAEAAANLVVGPNGPGYGDRDGDGVVAGANEQGLLPGLDGTPGGLASSLAANECVERDVLGGTSSDPAAAWAQMAEVITAWTPSDNTMPQLASHPMRVVGWATLTLGSDSLDEAHEFAGHAALHVSVSLAALGC